MTEEAKKAKILLVEDDVFMIELLGGELKNTGIEATIAKTGLEAVKKFTEVKPDLILLDLMLPDQNGFEALRQIRRDPAGMAVKVIVLSNLSERSDMEEAKRLGVLEYLVKAHHSLPEIVERIQKALRGS